MLAAISDKRIHFGPAGSGAAAKVINNAVAHAVMVVVAEAGSMATAAGVDCEKLVGLLADKQMGLHRPLTHRYAERIMQGNYEGGMPLEAARKDSVLALELAQSLKVPLFAIQGAHSVYEMALAAGYGRDDYAAVAKIWNDWGCPAVPAKAAGRA
nr:NAD-binding protein [Paracandidimonas soli]